MKTCPNCGFQSEPTDTECPKCGIIYEKWEAVKKREKALEREQDEERGRSIAKRVAIKARKKSLERKQTEEEAKRLTEEGVIRKQKERDTKKRIAKEEAERAAEEDARKTAEEEAKKAKKTKLLQEKKKGFFKSFFLLRLRKSVISLISICVILVAFIALFFSFTSKTSVSGGAWLVKGSGQSDIIRGMHIYILRKQVDKTSIQEILTELDTKSLELVKYYQAKGLEVANRALNAAKGVKRIKKHREDQDAGRIEMDSIGMRLKDQLSKVELHLKTRSGIERAKAYLSKAKACKAILTQVKTLLGEPENLMTDVEAIYLLIRKYNLAQSNEDSSEYSSIKEDKLWPKMVSLCKVSSVKTGIAGKYKIQNLDKDQYYLYALYITNFSLIEWFLPLDKDRGKSIFIDLYNENASQIINKED